MAITVTDTARDRVRAILARNPRARALRVGIRGGGCSGFSYRFELDEAEPRAGDKVFEMDGFTLYVDAKSYFYLNGSRLDFVDELMGQRFHFENPNVDSACGCGESVSFKVSPDEAAAG